MAGNKRSGRRPKPTELKVLEGTFRKDRHGDAPGVIGGFPQAPDWLSEDEKLLWDGFPRVAWIGQSDQIPVHGAVAIYARIRSNQMKQRETPEAGAPLCFKYSYDSDGNQNVEPKENPLISSEIKLWHAMLRFLAVLGLTPADRAKMTAPKVESKAEDKWAGLL